MYEIAGNNNIKIALTFDDAPSIDEKGSRFVSERMDEIRKVLTIHNIKDCTAFVVGKTAIGHEDKLARWVESGYQLANHTFEHCQCSDLSIAKFRKSVLDCDAILQSVNAFSNSNEKWFRYPFLNRGLDRAQRADFKLILDVLGYKISYTSIGFHDHLYESVFESMLNSGSMSQINKVSKRYLNSVVKTIHFMNSLSRKHFKQDFKHIVYAHFGGVSTALLEQLLDELVLQKIEWCSLTSASKCCEYNKFQESNSANGGVLDLVHLESTYIRIKRKLSRISVKMKLFEQNIYGPIWPHLL